MDSVLVPLGNLRLEGEIQINNLKASITKLLSSYLKSCNSGEIRIPENFLLPPCSNWGRYIWSGNFVVPDPRSSSPCCWFPLILQRKCVTKKVLKKCKEGPTWRCCQPKTKFICHTLWNISDEVIHMSVKIKMSPWTRPKREIVIYYISTGW